MGKYLKGFYVGETDVAPPELPVKLVTEGNRNVITAKTYLHSLMKKQIGNVLNDRPSDFDEKLYAFLENFYEQAYSNGLKDNDKMHKVVDKAG